MQDSCGVGLFRVLRMIKGGLESPVCFFRFSERGSARWALQGSGFR